MAIGYWLLAICIGQCEPSWGSDKSTSVCARRLWPFNMRRASLAWPGLADRGREVPGLGPVCARGDGRSEGTSFPLSAMEEQELLLRVVTDELLDYPALFNTPREGVARGRRCAKAHDVRSFHPGQWSTRNDVTS